MYPSDGINASGATALATWRGTPMDIVPVFIPQDTGWAEFTKNPIWVLDQYKGYPARISLAVPLNEPGSTLAQVAAGTYDSYFRTLAKNVVAAGRGDSDIRLGWEFNGDWYKWAATDPTSYKAAFRRISALFKSVSPSFTIDWNGNWGGSQVGHDPFTELYPGDDVVDVVGLDAYDGGWVPARTDADFTKWLNADHGLNDWLSFAKAHGKKLSVPEWGLSGTGEGDNPVFIRGMFAFFSANAAHIAYECYFNESASYIANSLHGPAQMPLSGAAYLAAW